jgi:hypothetical protein
MHKTLNVFGSFFIFLDSASRTLQSVFRGFLIVFFGQVVIYFQGLGFNLKVFLFENPSCFV